MLPRLNSIKILTYDEDEERLILRYLCYCILVEQEQKDKKHKNDKKHNKRIRKWTWSVLFCRIVIALHGVLVFKV